MTGEIPRPGQRSQRQNGAGHWVALGMLGLPLVLLILFLILPLILILVYSFYTQHPVTGLMQPDFSLSNYERVLSSDVYRTVFWRSFQIASLATLLALITAYPMSYAIAVMTPRRFQSILLLLIVIPFWTSYIIRTYAWIGILQRNGFLNQLLSAIPGLNLSVDLLYSRTAVTIGFVHVFLPLMILPIYASVRNLDQRLIEASSDLGAPPWRTFLRVTLPLTAPGIFAGVILFFIPCFGSFVTPQLLGGTGDLMIGNVIATQFGSAFNWPLGAALSVVMTLVVVVTLILFFRFARLESIYGD